MELSSGFSFRGLELVKQSGFHYIDTDLPDVITAKKDFINGLPGALLQSKSDLEILPLNALDEKNFDEIISHFPEGGIVIINEGLLMYLSNAEKKKLCSIIHKILKKRGGYWITADIYIKKQFKNNDFKINFNEQFYKEHQIEDNKFESFEIAESFFNEAGFIIDKQAEPDRSKLSTIKYLIKSENINYQDLRLKKVEKIRETWRLRVSKE